MLIVQKMEFPFDSIFFLFACPRLAILHLPQTGIVMRKVLSILLFVYSLNLEATGAVATGHPLATRAGLEVLEKMEQFFGN